METIWILLAFVSGFAMAVSPKNVVLVKGNAATKMVVEYDGQLYRLVKDV